MFLLMGENRVLSRFTPMGGFRDLDFEIESVFTEKNLKLGRLHSMIIGHSVHEGPQEPLFFSASNGRWSCHDQKVPLKRGVCLVKSGQNGRPNVTIATL